MKLVARPANDPRSERRACPEPAKEISPPADSILGHHQDQILIPNGP